MFKRIIISLIVLLMMTPAVSARVVEDVEMPETVMVGDYTVALNGAGVRQVMFMKPYVSGLYLRAAETDPTKILTADEPMAIRLELLSGQSRRMFLRALRNGMRAAAGSLDIPWESVEGRYEKFTEIFSDDFNKGDVMEFKYLPGEGVQLFKNNELRGTLEGFDFKQAYFGIWFNEDSPADSDLKAAMLAGDMRVAMADIKAEEMQLAAAETEAEEAAQRAEAEAEEAARRAAAEAEEAARKAEADARMLAEKKAAEEKARAEAEAKRATELAAREAEKETVTAPAISKDAFVKESVYFAFDDASLSAAAKKTLDKKVEWLKANPGVSIAIEASTDVRGPAVYNEWLAQRRGNSVKKYLTDAGINAARIDLVVIGEIATGDYAENRRVSFHIK